MKIRGTKPDQLPTKSAGVYYIRYRADGTGVMAKWPRGRPGKKTLPQSEQVQRWDKVILWVRDPESEAYALALQATQANAFYAKDILVMEDYGTYLSWPGWGDYPNGPAAGKVRLPVGTLRDVDGVRRKESYRNAGTLTVILSLWEPSDCRLYVSTLPPTSIASTVIRQGQRQFHGFRLWVPEALGEYAPTAGAGTDQPSWTVPVTVADNAELWWFVAHKMASPPGVNWSSALYPQLGTGPAPGYGWYYEVGGFIAGPAGFTPDPVDVAALNAAQQAVVDCLRSQAGVTVDQDAREVLFAGCDAAGFPGTLGPSPYPACFGYEAFFNAAAPAPPACVSPDPTADVYYWWVLFEVSPTWGPT